MLKGFVLGFIVALAAVAGAGYAVISSGLIPAGAEGKPGWFEKWAARTSLHATLDKEAPKGNDPVPLTEANLIAGIDLYARNCAICHGTAQGEASASPIARGEYPAPPQFAAHGVEDDPPGVTYWKVKHGIRWTGMPSWNGALSDQQIWTIALLLQHMDKLPPAAEQAWKQVQH
jgi:mono/diheme cytochrome c family protein